MEKTIGKYKIEITQETDCEVFNPRQDDNLGTMICFHNRYVLGDKDHGYSTDDYNSFEEMEQAIWKNENAGVVLPLYLLDHSGITMNTTGFSCPWDSGQIGFIFISKEKMRYEYSCKRVSMKLSRRVAGYLKSEVQTYDQYLTGDIWHYCITNTETDEEVDAVGGYFGSSDAMESAEETVKYLIQNDKEKNGVQLELEL